MSPEALSGVHLGTRVVVRHLIEGGERATDELGELLARDTTTLTVGTRRGPVRVPLAEIVAAKPVPAAPGGTGSWRVADFLRRAGVAVLDLDGVLRTVDSSGDLARAAAGLGLRPGDLMDTAFGLPEALAMVTGRARYADWLEALRARLLADAHPAPAVESLLATWVADHGTPLAPTVALVDELLAAGLPVLVFTNGTDRVPEELESTGLGHLVPHLLNAHELGFAQPAPEAYAVAHAEIERRLGRVVGRGEVHFTDDRPANVDAARVFGWRARVFTLPTGRR